MAPKPERNLWVFAWPFLFPDGLWALTRRSLLLLQVVAVDVAVQPPCSTVLEGHTDPRETEGSRLVPKPVLEAPAELNTSTSGREGEAKGLQGGDGEAAMSKEVNMRHEKEGREDRRSGVDERVLKEKERKKEREDEGRKSEREDREKVREEGRREVREREGKQRERGREERGREGDPGVRRLDKASSDRRSRRSVSRSRSRSPSRRCVSRSNEKGLCGRGMDWGGARGGRQRARRGRSH